MVCCFFKQKTAYEMRISDWSSDVCSSDLGRGGNYRPPAVIPRKEKARAEARASPPWQAGRSSEWQPVLLLAKFHIADVGAEPRADARSEERRVGKACVSTCRSRWSPYH